MTFNFSLNRMFFRRDKIMNKADLISKIAGTVSISKADANRVLDSFVNVVSDALKKGDNVAISGFGTFKVIQRKAREGRNPRTGEMIKIKATKAPKFVPGKTLKEGVNK